MSNTNSISSQPVPTRATVAGMLSKIEQNLDETRFVQLKLRGALNGENDTAKEDASPSPAGVMHHLAMLERRSLDNMQLAHDILSFFSDGGN